MAFLLTFLALNISTSLQTVDSRKTKSVTHHQNKQRIMIIICISQMVSHVCNLWIWRLVLSLLWFSIWRQEQTWLSGSTYKSTHIRLNKIFLNKNLGKLLRNFSHIFFQTKALFVKNNWVVPMYMKLACLNKYVEPVLLSYFWVLPTDGTLYCFKMRPTSNRPTPQAFLWQFYLLSFWNLSIPKCELRMIFMSHTPRLKKFWSYRHTLCQSSFRPQFSLIKRSGTSTLPWNKVKT